MSGDFNTVDMSFLDALWLVISASCVFLMQAGFLCLEAGSTRRKNSINVVIKNTADFGVSTLAFWAVGYGFMFGHSAWGWVGQQQFLIDLTHQSIGESAFWLFQVMFCGTAVTILSGAVAGRMSFRGYIALAALISGLIYPLYGHWAWNGLNQATLLGWLGKRGFVDFAGSTVVHSLGGWCALTTIIFIGPRLGRFSQKRSASTVAVADLPLAFTGTLVLWFGWFGFNGGSTLAFNEQVPLIIGNTLIAGAAGLTLPMLITLCRQTILPPKFVINGTLAGLVAITANCHAVSTVSALFIGAIGSLVMLATDWLLERCHIDDVVGAVPVHLGAGIWGTLAVAFFGDLSILGTGLTRWGQFKVQLAGVLTCGLWSFSIMLLSLAILNAIWPLRVSQRQEFLGLNVAEHDAKGNLHDFYSQMSRHARTGNLKRSISANAFTEEGQLGQWYNRVVTTLEQAVDKTEAIFKTAGEGIVTVSPETLLIQSLNPQIEKIFGYEQSHLLNQPLSQILDLSAQGALEHCDLHRLLSTASTSEQPFELMGKHRKGTLFEVEMTVTQTMVYQDVFYTLMVRDISERKRAEVALQQSELRERQKAIELTDTLKQLQQTQTMLIQTEKMAGLGQLAAGIAHEINNPVNFIHGNLNHSENYVEDLLEIIQQCCQQKATLPPGIQTLLEELDAEFLAEDFPKVLSSMQTGTQRIQTIVKSLKDFVCLDESELKEVDIHRALDNTLSILSQQLRANDNRAAIQLNRQYSPHCPLIECYAGQLNQAFYHLLLNSIEALEAKVDAPSITIETAVLADSLLIRFMDNGSGIPQDIQSRIFEPFFTTKAVGEGTGLGLSVSYQIVVNQHGGELTCAPGNQEPKGQGTTITIKLPLSQVQPPAFSPASTLSV